jgi:hypothetical protein
VNRAFGLTCADEQLFCRAVTFLIIIPCRNSRTLPLLGYRYRVGSKYLIIRGILQGVRFGKEPYGFTANRTLNRLRSAGRAYQGVEVIVLKELGKMTP